jgi:hypothetical protein
MRKLNTYNNSNFYKNKETKEYKRWHSKLVEAMNRPEVKKKLASFGMKGKKHTEASKEKMRTSSVSHHIDLNKLNNKDSNKLELKNEASHQKLHRYAYQYLLEKYGLKEIKRYILWTIQNGIVQKIKKKRR